MGRREKTRELGENHVIEIIRLPFGGREREREKVGKKGQNLRQNKAVS